MRLWLQNYWQLCIYVKYNFKLMKNNKIPKMNPRKLWSNLCQCQITRKIPRLYGIFSPFGIGNNYCCIRFGSTTTFTRHRIILFEFIKYQGHYNSTFFICTRPACPSKTTSLMSRRWIFVSFSITISLGTKFLFRSHQKRPHYS